MVLKTYKQIYKNIIEKENEIIEQTKRMIEADKHIKTTYVMDPIKRTNKIRAIFNRQKAEINRIERIKYQKKVANKGV